MFPLHCPEFNASSSYIALPYQKHPNYLPIIYAYIYVCVCYSDPNPLSSTLQVSFAFLPYH